MRAKRWEIAYLRKVLTKAKDKEANLEDSLTLLEEKSLKILRREILALGVMNSLDSEQEFVLAKPEFV